MAAPERTRRQVLLALVAAGLAPAWAQPAGGAAAASFGLVLMHGKGGAPTGLVADLAAYLQAQGFLLRNLEMPWSARRQYDAAPEQAQAQVAQALAELRREGAQRLLLIGHSQGAVFALHLAAHLPLDGVVAIAPGGNTSTDLFAHKLGTYLERARAMVSAGQGAQEAEFSDYEGNKGLSVVRTRADWYLAWFDPQGVMAQERALRAVPPTVPVLYLAPTGDYPALRRANPALFALLPAHPSTRMEQPECNHAQAPTVARERLVRWALELAQAAR